MSTLPRITFTSTLGVIGRKRSNRIERKAWVGLRGKKMAPIAFRGKKRGIVPKTRKSQNLASSKVWSLKKADKMFRLYMLKKVPHECVFPDCPITDPKKLTVSHYHGRVKKGTRFQVTNCVLLCRNHHYWDKQRGWEFQKQTKDVHGWDGRYTLYMRELLGEHAFSYLLELAESGMKPKPAIQHFQNLLTTLKD